MPLAKGDIVLVPFPFTDLSQTKLRPAVVLWVASQGQNVSLCFITSQNVDRLAEAEFDIAASHPEFSGTGLKVASKVRVTRLITLERPLLRRRLGKLGKQLMQDLDQSLINAFRLGASMSDSDDGPAAEG